LVAGADCITTPAHVGIAGPASFWLPSPPASGGVLLVLEEQPEPPAAKTIAPMADSKGGERMH
jgi:hypothetical protein